MIGLLLLNFSPIKSSRICCLGIVITIIDTTVDDKNYIQNVVTVIHHRTS